MKDSFTKRNRVARLVAFGLILSSIIAAIVIPFTVGGSQAAAASPEKSHILQQATEPPPTEPPPTEPPPTEPPPTEPPPTEPPPTEPPPTEPPPTEPPPTEPPPTEPPPTAPPPAPTATAKAPSPTTVPTNPPAPTAVPTRPPAPTAKPADPQPAQPAPPTATLAPTAAAPVTATTGITGGAACTVIVRTGLLVRLNPVRNSPSQAVILRTEAFTATGRTANNVYAFGVTAKGVQGWVLANGLRCTSLVRRLPVVQAQSVLPKPAATPTPRS